MTGRRFKAAEGSDEPGHGDRSVRELAARTIRLRLQAVWRGLHAACGDLDDGESVHRLRVATRRAIAAFDAFDDLVPDGGGRWFRRRLRRIRRSAGDARDLDVLVERISGDSPPSSGVTARRRLIAMLARQRPAARQSVIEQRERLAESNWSGRAGRLVDRIAQGGHAPPPAAYCRRRMKRLVSRFFDRASRGPRRAGELHRLRIDGKRLRYSLEILAPVLPPSHRAKCEKTLESLQESLGRYTDHAAIAERLRRWPTRGVVTEDRRLLEAMRRAEADAADSARRGFVRWWTRSRRRALQKRFRRALRKEPA
jgi:CHAD domain-containing protein